MLHVIFRTLFKYIHRRPQDFDARNLYDSTSVFRFPLGHKNRAIVLNSTGREHNENVLRQF